MGHKCNNYSDYGSGSSSSSSSWASQQDIRWPTSTPKETMERPSHKSSSYSDLVMGRCTLEDVMRDFHMNGSDSPYNPDEDRIWGKHSELSGMGPSGAYVRQKSWPAPERSPALRLPRPQPEFTTRPQPEFTTRPQPEFTTRPQPEFTTSTPIFDEGVAPFAPLGEPASPEAAASLSDAGLTCEQARALGSLPAALLHSLLQQLHQEKRSKPSVSECRFCKNNGEREWYCRSHVLKDAWGRVRCPVLRAFRCARCGAAGDRAHTIKYCPLSTNEERIKSAAMMRSVRMASGRRRACALPPSPPPPPPPAPAPAAAAGHYLQAPLDPLWAALEQKLML